MANRSWNFDAKEVVTSEGAVVKWEDHRFFKLTYKGQSFHCELLEEGSENNQLTIKVNQRVINVTKKGELDELIAALGLDVPKVRKLKELQAPMPGRIVRLSIEIGQELQPGDEILALEAMKMENILKAEGIGKVKAILVTADQVVDKGTILIEFE
ncbi:MAG: biotin/lipoyl-containing protein [Bacteroidota bacterium]